MLDPKRFFPKNVWVRTMHGFYSRPLTKADQLRREAYLVRHMEWLSTQPTGRLST
jgi:hypothetical protein